MRTWTESKEFSDYVQQTVKKKCFACKEEAKDCKQCSRCGMVRYCGRKCQSVDYRRHRRHCKEVKELADMMDKEETGQPIKQISFNKIDKPANFRVTYRSNFRVAVAFEMMRCGFNDNNKFAMEMALRNMFKFLNDDTRDNTFKQDVRNAMPFIMLALGHRQRAYDLVKTWIFERFAVTYKRVSRNAKNKLPMSFQYFNNDISSDFVKKSGIDESFYFVSELLFFLAVKFSYLADLHRGNVEVPFTKLAETYFLKLRYFGTDVKDKIEPERQNCRKDQLKMAHKLMKMIDEDLGCPMDIEPTSVQGNMLILSALLDPTPMFRMPFVEHMPGKMNFVDEARHLIEFTHKVFRGIPGALSFIRRVLWEDRPAVNWYVQTFMEMVVGDAFDQVYDHFEQNPYHFKKMNRQFGPLGMFIDPFEKMMGYLESNPSVWNEIYDNDE